MASVDRVFWGTIDAMIAEVGAKDYGNRGKNRYAVMCDGDAQWDTELFRTKAEAKADAAYIAREYKVHSVFVG